MTTEFYKLRRQKAVSGVLAGLSDRFGWDLSLVRVLFMLAIFFTHIPGILIYFILAFVLPYKEDLLEEQYGTGPRKVKQAKPVKDDNDGWFW